MNTEKIGGLDDPVQLAEAIRLEYGAQLPAAPPRESHSDRERRREKTQFALEKDVMPLINRARVQAARPVLSVDEEDHVVELVLSAMFLLPHLFGILEREPMAEDLVVFGADPVRVDLADGQIKEYAPLVPFDAALERIISNVAMDHHRPFSFEAPFVDVQLAPHLRLHGQGFDVVSRPAIFIRVHRVLGATIDEMVAAGSMSRGLGYMLKTVVPEAQLSVNVTGPQGSGKTTVLRAMLLAYPESTRMVTVESDFELGMVSLGRRWTQEMQARLPVTSKWQGITPAGLMPHTLRTRADVLVIGEVRGDEGAAAIRAAGVGQGAMCTVHGISAQAGLEQLVDRLAETGTPQDIARRMTYGAFDIVVHCTVNPGNRLRWVGEVVAPLLEGGEPKIHQLWEPPPHASDLRPRASKVVWPAQLLNKIRSRFPDFDEDLARDDTYAPHTRIGVADPSRNGHGVHT